VTWFSGDPEDGTDWRGRWAMFAAGLALGAGLALLLVTVME